MSSATHMDVACCRCSAHVSATSRLSLNTTQANRTLLATPSRVRKSSIKRTEQRPGIICSFGAAAGAWGDTTSSSMLSLSHMASLAGFALGALFVGRELAMEQRDEQQGEVCGTCNGTGRVPCFCQRWSDGEVGCSGCGNTGMTYCKDCSGGGTKVPVSRAVPIYVKEENKYRQQGPYNCSCCDHSHRAEDSCST